MNGLEFVPVGTILTVSNSQDAKTSNVEFDVVIDKESFEVLSKHMPNIASVL